MANLHILHRPEPYIRPRKLNVVKSYCQRLFLWQKKLSSNVGFRFQQYADCPMMQHPPVINHDKRITYKHIHLRRNTQIIFTNTHTQMHSLELIKSRVGKQRASNCNISRESSPPVCMIELPPPAWRPRVIELPPPAWRPRVDRSKVPRDPLAGWAKLPVPPYNWRHWPHSKCYTTEGFDASIPI